MAAIDLGGGSVQQAFALTAEESEAAPDGFVMPLSGGPKTYNVYVHRQAATPHATDPCCAATWALRAWQADGCADMRGGRLAQSLHASGLPQHTMKYQSESRV